jgi:hypothetical protein
VTPDDREDVSRVRIGHGDTRVRGSADRYRDARHDFVRDTLFVEKQRFLASAVENERIAPFQPDDCFAFARFFREQEGDRILFQRFRGGRTYVNALGRRLGTAEEPRVDPMVIDDDVGGLQIALAANAHERRIARARADDVYAG